MSARSVNHRAASWYASRGLRVFPTLPRSKQPHGRFVRHGFKEATDDREQIDRWWTADPTAGVAVSCAASGIVVLDVDPRNAGDESLGRLERELGPLPSTPRVLTPAGGQHLYFRDDVGSYVATAGEGVDVKSAGYVLAPPSVHPNGKPYRWDVGAHITGTLIAGLPDRWLAHLTKRKAAAPSRESASPLPSSGIDARDSWLGAAFDHLGWLGDAHPDGRRNVRCPWAHEHTDGRGLGEDSSSVLFSPASGRTLGGFLCSHGHCSWRGWREVFLALPRDARAAADRAFPRQDLGRSGGAQRTAFGAK